MAANSISEDGNTEPMVSSTTANAPPVGVVNPSLTPSLQIDVSHPYDLTPFDNPGTNLLNVSFDGSSYGNWRRGVLISFYKK